MNGQAIATMLTSIVPFIKTVGLVIDDVSPGKATASLENTKPIQNHMGTVHAGALYTLGESATGAVVLSVFADLLPNVFIALKSATVQHTKAREGKLVASAVLKGDPKAIRAGYDQSGKADFDVDVTFTVDGTPVANVSYTWAARAPRT